MPGSPATSPKFAAPRFADSDTASFSAQVNGVTDMFDSKALITGGTETLASLTITGAGTALSVAHSATIGGQVTLTGTGSANGLVIGGDATLYRSAAGTLRTGGALIADGNLTVSGTLSVAGSLTFGALGSTGSYTQTGTSTNTFSGATSFTSIGTGLIVSNAASIGGNLIVSGQLKVPTVGSGAGLLIGGDSTLYRDAANSLRTGGALTVDGAGLVKTSLTLDVGAGTAGFTLTLTGRSGGTAANATLTVGSTGTLTYNVPSAGGQTHVFAIGGTTAATISPAAFSIAAGGKYQVGGTQISLSDLSNTTTGTGTTLVLSVSPIFAGIPKAPTAPAGTSTDQIATTAFVQTALTAGLGDLADGSRGAPSLAFVSEADSGLYKNAARDIRFSVRGADVFQMYNPVGASTPLATVSGNLNVTGQYQAGGSQLSLSNLSNPTTGAGSTVVLNSGPTFTGVSTFGGGTTVSTNVSVAGNATVGVNLTVTGQVIGSLQVQTSVITGGWQSLDSGGVVIFAVGSTHGTQFGSGAGKIGFFGTSPIGQPTNSSSGGFIQNTQNPNTAMYSGSTSTGSVGSTAYNFNQIVMALKNLGLIAS